MGEAGAVVVVRNATCGAAGAVALHAWKERRRPEGFARMNG
jgi:hypothetical protein